jgi:hypothetical protein
MSRLLRTRKEGSRLYGFSAVAAGNAIWRTSSPVTIHRRYGSDTQRHPVMHDMRVIFVRILAGWQACPYGDGGPACL